MFATDENNAVTMLRASSATPGPNPLSGHESAHQQPTIAEAGNLPHPAQSARSAPSSSRLTAVAEGKPVPPETHAAVSKEDPVLTVDNFNLWYGAKQALHG